MHEFIRITRYVVQGCQWWTVNSAGTLFTLAGSLYSTVGEGKRRHDDFEGFLQIGKNFKANSASLLSWNTQIKFSSIQVWTRIYFYWGTTDIYLHQFKKYVNSLQLEGQDMNIHRIWIYKCQRSVVVATCKSKFIKPGNILL